MARPTIEDFKKVYPDMYADQVLAMIKKMSPEDREKADKIIRSDMFTISDDIMRSGTPMPRLGRPGGE